MILDKNMAVKKKKDKNIKHVKIFLGHPKVFYRHYVSRGNPNLTLCFTLKYTLK